MAIMKESPTAKKLLGLLSLLILILLATGCADKTRNFESLKEAGTSALGAGNYNKAIENLKAAYRLQPSDRDVLYFLGVAYQKMPLIDSALAYFRRAALLYPNDRAVNKELADLCAYTGDYRGALRAIAVMIATGDNERMYWPVLAELNYRDNNYELSAKYYRLAMEDSPEDKSLYLLYSGTLSQMGKFEEANRILVRAMEKFGPSAEVYANQAINYVNMKDLNKAENYMRKAAELNPESVPIWLNLGNILSSENATAKKNEALQIFLKYRTQAPPAYNLDSIITVLQKEIQGG